MSKENAQPNVVCFFHRSDFDGKCSGAIVYGFHKDTHPTYCIGVNYYEPLDKILEKFSELFTPETIVYVVDFMFTLEEMEFLNKHYSLVWVDHHETNINTAHTAGFIANMGQSLEVGEAACELTWKLLHKEAIPVPVQLLGRYDVWDHEGDPRIIPFQYGLRIVDNTYPDADIWPLLLKVEGAEEEFVTTGAILLKYEMLQNEIVAKGMVFEKEFHGQRAVIINKPFSNSQLFASVYDPEKHDIMIVFGCKDGVYQYSLYSVKEDVDVSKIAKKYEGGGGHKGAAGFRTKNYIFE